VVYNRVGEMVQDLKNGRLQAILLDQSTAEPIAAKEQLFKTPVQGLMLSSTTWAWPHNMVLKKSIF